MHMHADIAMRCAGLLSDTPSSNMHEHATHATDESVCSGND